MSAAHRAALHNAPPRLSDLRGDAFRRAVAERHAWNRAQWWAARQMGGLQLAIERWFGGRV